MKCRDISHLLADYLDDSLDADTKKAVKDHLSLCGNCREDLQFLKKYFKKVSSLPLVKAPDDFLGKVHERLGKRSPLKNLVRKLFFPMKFKIPLEALGVVAMAALIVLIFNPFKVNKRKVTTEMDGFNIATDRKLPEEPATISEKAAHEDLPSVMNKRSSIDEEKEGSSIGYTGEERNVVREKSAYRDSVDKKGAQSKEEIISDDRTAPEEITIIVKAREDTVSSVNVRDGVFDKTDMKKEATKDTGNKYRAMKKKRSPGMEEYSVKQMPVKKPVEEIQEIARSLQGTIIKKEVDQKTGKYRLMVLELPAKNYDAFVVRLNRTMTVKKLSQPEAQTKMKKARSGKLKLNVELAQ